MLPQKMLKFRVSEMPYHASQWLFFFFLLISGVVGKVPVYASQEVTSKGRDVYP